MKTPGKLIVVLLLVFASLSMVQAKSMLGIFDAVWSPDGTQLALSYQNYVDPNSLQSAVYLLDVHAKDLTPVKLVDNAIDPAWSPDGTQILYSPINGEGVYVVNVDGSSDPTQLARIGYSSQWSPDGTQIKFHYGGAVYLMGADGSKPHQLVGSKLKSIWGSNWSPDGQMLTLVADGEKTDTSMIYTVDASGENLKALIDSDYSAYNMSISPDGKLLALSAKCGERIGLCIMNLDGSNPKLLNNGNMPHWSPDGSKLAYVRNAKICVMTLADEAETCITSGVDHSPAWSPDGSQLVFLHDVRPTTPDPKDYVYESQAFIINADGTNLRQIVIPDVATAQQVNAGG